jgi:preprotein translocase subunit SecA
VTEYLTQRAFDIYNKKEKEFGADRMREVERVILLRSVDEYWMEHIDAMDDLRQGVSLRAYSQINPIDEYKREGYDMFEAMIGGIKEEVVRRLYIARVKKEQTLERKSVAKNQNAINNAGGDDSVKPQPVKKTSKPGRNDPCPCGKKRPNGLPMKYKDCCGRDE